MIASSSSDNSKTDMDLRIIKILNDRITLIQKLLSKVSLNHCGQNNADSNYFSDLYYLYSAIQFLSFELGDFLIAISCGFLKYHIIEKINSISSEEHRKLKIQTLIDIGDVYIQVISIPKAGKMLLNVAKRLLEETDNSASIFIDLTISQSFILLIEHKYYEAVSILENCIFRCKNNDECKFVLYKARKLLAKTYIIIGNYDAAYSITMELRKTAQIEKPDDWMTSQKDIDGIEGIALAGLDKPDEAIKLIKPLLKSTYFIDKIDLLATLGNCYYKKMNAENITLVGYFDNFKNAVYYTYSALVLAKKNKIASKYIQMLTLFTEIRFFVAGHHSFNDDYFLNMINDAKKITTNDYFSMGAIYLLYAEYLLLTKDPRALEIGLKAESEIRAQYLSEESILEIDLTLKDRNLKIVYLTLQNLYLSLNNTYGALLIAEKQKMSPLNYSSQSSIIEFTIEQVKAIASFINASILFLSDAYKETFSWLIYKDPTSNEFKIVFNAFRVIEHDEQMDEESLEEADTIANSKKLFQPSIENIQFNFTELLKSDSQKLFNRSFIVDVIGPEEINFRRQMVEFQAIISHVENYLPVTPNSKLLIVPHIGLSQVRFSSAKLKDNQSMLVDRFIISIAPSIFAALHSNSNCKDEEPSEKRNEPTAVIIGDPSFSLPFAQLESEAVKDILIKSSISPKLFSQDAAKEKILSEMKSCLILHIASHGDTEPDLRRVVSGRILLKNSDIGKHFVVKHVR